MPPRIAHVNKYWGRDRGGVEAVLDASVTGLARQGYPVTVLACRPWGSATRPAPTGVRIEELPAPVIARMPVNFGFARALRAVMDRHDLLHFHLPFPLAEAAANQLSKRQPWVATLHAEVLGHAAWMRQAQAAITRAFLARCDLILASSPAACEAAPLAPFLDRVRILPFGFELAHYWAASRRSAQPRARRIAFLGRMVKYKGLDVLLHAAARLARDTRFCLTLIGDGPERSRIERMARRLHVDHLCEFLGHVPDVALPRHLAAARVFVLPSLTRAEAFGVAQVEAMAAGCAVVNTALATGVPWVSPANISGLTVPPGDASALAVALRRLLTDDELCRACSHHAQLRARAMFSLERHGPALETIYQELLPCRFPVASTGPPLAMRSRARIAAAS